jgi:hypothetical protein
MLALKNHASRGTLMSAVWRINISNIVMSNADPRYASSVTGVPVYPVEDLRISNLHVVHQRGGAVADASIEIAPIRSLPYPQTCPLVGGIEVATDLAIKLERVETV